MKDVINKLLSLSEEANSKPIIASGPEIHQSTTYAIDYPHLFVLSCIMDRQYDTTKAWEIPCKVCQKYAPSYQLKDLASVSEAEYVEYFVEKKLHRFNEKMAKNFCSAVKRIVDEYKGDASQIWANEPSSAEVIYHFLQFKGVGVKIATMAANILHRDYGVKFSDYHSLDVSADTHVLRVMYRLGLVNDRNSIEQAIYKARDISPDYPGIIDRFCWELGKDGICSEQNPRCSECPMNDVCKKMIK